MVLVLQSIAPGIRIAVTDGWGMHMQQNAATIGFLTYALDAKKTLAQDQWGLSPK